MKLNLSKKIIWIFLLKIISTLVVNSYFIAELNRALNWVKGASATDSMIMQHIKKLMKEVA